MGDSIKTQEIRIPVPWGHIAAKTWGDEKDKAVLAIHGRMDNAGAFDRLIPLLPTSFYYICVDLPGHGRSSHFPPYVPLYTVTYLMVYKLIMQYFQRNSYIVIGHSYGGHIGFLFAQTYPHLVEKLVMLDTVHTIPVPSKNFKYYLADKIDNNLELQKKLKTGKQPTYTYDEALNRLLNGRQVAPLKVEAAKPLLERGVEPAENGRFKFTLDQRMKCYIDPLHDNQYAVATMKWNRVSCPILFILASESTLQQTVMKPIIQVLKKWRNVTIKYVTGDHDVHNNTPEVVAPHIIRFLLKTKSKL
ncbi:hypothetical protein NQ317_006060 [Molorchus minor]|uniref:AB hydrolase-1 domain-containing protein n=1 Tax=Molorchus minor TaxID=1323400 RepID=A0ABQ9K2H2_9CUCU|nr:hypothetical protein NQ317_006060 [Molorchus minor]